MRTPPASVLKSGRKLTNFTGLPQPGTHLREVYDLFKINKGRIIDFTHNGKNAGVLRQLTDFYGCDIRQISRGKCRKAGRWMLVGEWIGEKYVSYFEPE